MLTNNEILSEAYALLKENLWNIVGVNLVFMLISIACSFVPFGSIILGGPLGVGIALYSIKIRNNENATMSDLFEGFKNFGNSIGAYFLMMVIILVGCLLLIIPGIFLAFALSMVMFIVADDFEINPIDAIKKSYRMMDGYKGKYFILMLAVFGISILGIVLTLGIGLFFIVPFSYLVQAVFYEEVRAAYEGTEKLDEIDLIGA